MGVPLLLFLAVPTFLAWAGCMLLTLFQIRQIGKGARYAGQPGLGATLSSFRLFLTLPEWRVRRWILLGLTMAVIGINLMLFLNTEGTPV